MEDFLPSAGTVQYGDIFTILARVDRHGVNGILEVTTPAAVKKLVLEGGRVVFACSSLTGDSLGHHLIRSGVISEAELAETSRYIKGKRIRFGRGLIEKGYLGYEQLWGWVRIHLRSIVDSLFTIQEGQYRIRVDSHRETENIMLDLEIPEILLDNIRDFDEQGFITRQFEGVTALHIVDPKKLSSLPLKPHEHHVYEVARREVEMVDILRKSELLERDTIRLLFLFLILGILSTEQRPAPDPVQGSKNGYIDRSGAFSSCEEALDYYNEKYELVYKTLSKEIGPIAQSLLVKAIEDIIEVLPSFLKKVTIDNTGKIVKAAVMKTLWYHDLKDVGGEFVRGLEEILYTEIYAVKKHLGIKYEQQVLQWLRGTGN